VFKTGTVSVWEAGTLAMATLAAAAAVMDSAAAIFSLSLSPSLFREERPAL